LLRLEGGRFHSGTTLGAELGITRAAVNKHVAALRAEGIPVQSVPGKGYRLDPAIRFLDPQRIRAHLDPAACSITELHVYRSLPSTSDYLHQASADRSIRGMVCLAESQHAGRGRRGNNWVATPYRNLMLSLGWEYPQWPVGLTTFGLAAAVAVARELNALGVEDIGVKWPNDLIWNGRKLGGMLIDVRGETSGQCSIVIGVGVNVDMAPGEAERIPQPWADLSAALDAVPDRNLLAGRLISAFVELCLRFPDSGFRPWAADWERLHVLTGRRVRVVGGQSEVVGTVRGIDELGALLVVDAQAHSHRFFNGEVSVRTP
jgi:BirA family biotin operon repressor/biotin-[acetyl-CoA-carboxylase] ligase